MADQGEILEFVIDGYSPDTLPMARLAEYLTDLSALLGEKDRVHLIRVTEGNSAVLVHRIEHVAVTKVRARVQTARVRDAESEERRAFEAIDHKLRADNTSGYLRQAASNEPSVRLLFFPGRTRNVDPEYGPFNEQGSFQGRIISVGGKGRLANVNLLDGETLIYCEASREMTVQLAPLIYYVDVRVYGVGRYFRNADGEWEMRGFRIAHFEKLETRPLSETVERLRDITRRVGLSHDILHKLADLRGDPSES